ncbi:hypothetical protein D9619_006126 [Psilocybe cf. subviscida]|uniref:Uncharacterized protein n=1 Tax=Psilocybe cf. subviscida TaxID=2480587 RepID=A0A8H5B4L7_9AGAR|nr:hypothetical protein D9619_006126 [Psilocybe cf. subviscida]
MSLRNLSVFLISTLAVPFLLCFPRQLTVNFPFLFVGDIPFVSHHRLVKKILTASTTSGSSFWSSYANASLLSVFSFSAALSFPAVGSGTRGPAVLVLISASASASAYKSLPASTNSSSSSLSV